MDDMELSQRAVISALRQRDMTPKEIRTDYLPNLAHERLGGMLRRMVNQKMVRRNELGKYVLTDVGLAVEPIEIQQVRYVACHAIERRQETLHVRSINPDVPPVTLCGRAVRRSDKPAMEPGTYRYGRPRDLPFIVPAVWGCDSDWCSDCTTKAERLGLIPGRRAMQDTEGGPDSACDG